MGADFANDCRSDRSQSPDADLLKLEGQFIALMAELDGQVGEPAPSQDFVTTKEEALLARLDPIERAIMESPAQTITGLSVKARHLAHVLSEYWEDPIDQISWEGRAVRLLVEAICEVARVPLRT